jgi:hypothetical protein
MSSDIWTTFGATIFSFLFNEKTIKGKKEGRKSNNIMRV